MKIDLERQVTQCQVIADEVVAGQATLEQLCIDTRGLLFMAQVAFASLSSVMTEEMIGAIRALFVRTADVAANALGPEALDARSDDGNVEDDKIIYTRRVINHVSEFDEACAEFQARAQRQVATMA